MSDKLESLYQVLKRKVTKKRSKSTYPPELSETQASTLVSAVKDWQINHGSLLKLVRTEEHHSILARPIGASLFPTPFPAPCFEQACEIQVLYNELYAAIACDDEWLEEVLQHLITHDRFVSTLWSIHQQVKAVGYAQDLTLGLFRSDYMLDGNSDPKSRGPPLIKQVELNGIACAGGVHSNRISDMHQHLAKTGIYRAANSQGQVEIDLSRLRTCHTTTALVSGLRAAHELYGPLTSEAKQKGIIMVVQPYNVNVCDERPIEYGLWSQDPPVAMYRVLWGAELLSRTELTSSRALLFRTPSEEIMEVSVVYLRAGLDKEEYDDVGIATRLRLEKSRAINCPSVLSHMTTFKKVQQALTSPGMMEKFLSANASQRLSETFMTMYPLDESEQGLRGRKLALNSKTAVGYVLKPSLEGGGHNIYGEAIPGFLSNLPDSSWANYVLMKMIVPPQIHNVLMSPRGLYLGSVRSELGIFGRCIWRRHPKTTYKESDRARGCEILLNEQDGFSFKTKAENINEMSVVKGYGCFDSPFLVDLETFQQLCQL